MTNLILNLILSDGLPPVLSREEWKRKYGAHTLQ